jgi:hypothetical protein
VFKLDSDAMAIPVGDAIGKTSLHSLNMEAESLPG